MKMNEDLVQSFREHLKKEGRSKATIESYGRDSLQFVEFIDKYSNVDDPFDPKSLVAFQNHLRDIKASSANTLRRVTISVRQFCRFMALQQNMTQAPYDFVAIPSREEGIPSEEILDQIGQLLENSFAAKSNELIPARNSAILCLIGYCGLKTNELIELKWKNLHLNPDQVSTLHIEGRRKRVIELDSRTKQALLKYQALHEPISQNFGEPMSAQFVFKAFKGRDASIILPCMSRHGLKFALYEIGEKYGFDHLNADLLRHHAIFFHLSEEGKSPTDVMNLLGLKRVGLIRKYSRISGRLGDPVDFVNDDFNEKQH